MSRKCRQMMGACIRDGKGLLIWAKLVQPWGVCVCEVALAGARPSAGTFPLTLIKELVECHTQGALI